MLDYQLQLAKDALTISFAKNQTLPSLAMVYTYGIHGLGDTPSNAYDMSFDRNFDEHTATLRLDVPIGNEAARSQLRRAMLQRLQDLSSKSAQALQIRKEVLDAIDSLESMWNHIRAGRARTVLGGTNPRSRTAPVRPGPAHRDRCPGRPDQTRRCSIIGDCPPWPTTRSPRSTSPSPLAPSSATPASTGKNKSPPPSPST